MDQLKQAVHAYARQHAGRDGLTLTPIPGLRLKCVEVPDGDLHSIYRPLVCLVLQGGKRMVAAGKERFVSAGQSVIVSADIPIVGRIVQACRDQPYLAIAIDLEMTVLREVAAQLGSVSMQHHDATRTLFTEDTEAAALDCALRLLRLLDRPDAIPLLRPGIMRELHYWLLSGQHGAALRSLADPASHASRLGAAIAILRADYRSRIPVERLAAAAGMSLTAFHKHFKHMTSLTPGQYQKRLRLIEARRLMLDEGLSASSSAFDVGYESVSQFTREYGRLFHVPPRRDARRTLSDSSSAREQVVETGMAGVA